MSRMLWRGDSSDISLKDLVAKERGGSSDIDNEASNSVMPSDYEVGDY